MDVNDPDLVALILATWVSLVACKVEMGYRIRLIWAPIMICHKLAYVTLGGIVNFDPQRRFVRDE